MAVAVQEESAGPSQETIRIVVIAASAGGVTAVGDLLEELPAELPVPIVIVQHLSADYPSALNEILQMRCALRVKWAMDGERLKGGTVYLAPPNRHVTVAAPGVVVLTSSKRVNWVRPAADVLFASVAQSYGSQALAIVLTGCLYDGTAGSVDIKQAGGWVLVQDEKSSVYFDMPRSVISRGAVDFVLPLEMMPFAIIALVMSFGATSLFRVPSRLLPSPRELTPVW